MSKVEEIQRALIKASVTMNVVWNTVKKGGNPGELQLLREAIDACRLVAYDQDQTEGKQ